MASRRNTIPPRKSLSPVAAYLAAGPGMLALNRAEEPGELALCFVSLPAEVPEWIELVPGGAIAGADGRAFVNDRPAEFVARSAALKRIQAGWCIDFDHQLQLATNPMAGGTAPAAGWIVELQARDGGSIWGKVEWTDLGAEAIARKRYRGISPVFRFDKESKRALGLASAALTNNPNLDLVALNARQPSQQENDSMPAWLKKLLGLADDATEEQAKSALNSYVALAGALATALGVDVGAAVALDGPALNAALGKKFGAGASDVFVALCAKAGVKADATAEAILAGLQVEPDPAQYVPMAAHMALKDALNAVSKGKPAELVEQALKDGRLFPAQKEWALNYAQRDLAGFQKYIGDTPALLGTVKPPAAATAVNHGLTDNQLAICTRLGLDPKAYAEANGIKAAA
jgi:phage I-like protein